MIKKTLVKLLVCALTVGCVIGCSASNETSELNASLKTLGQKTRGTFLLMNLMEGKETLAEKKTFQINDGVIEFACVSTNQDESYEYKDGKIVLPDGKLPSATFDTNMQFENLSQVAGVDLKEIDKNDVESVKKTIDGDYSIYEVVMHGSAGTQVKSNPIVWLAKYRKYMVDSHGDVVRIEVGDTPEYAMAVVIEK